MSVTWAKEPGFPGCTKTQRLLGEPTKRIHSFWSAQIDPPRL